MFLERERMNRCRHGVITDRTAMSAARIANGAAGDIPPTRESMNRPVANGIAVPAAVNATESGEYTKTIPGEDHRTDARNRNLPNLLLHFPSVSILSSYTAPFPESDNKTAGE